MVQHSELFTRRFIQSLSALTLWWMQFGAGWRRRLADSEEEEQRRYLSVLHVQGDGDVIPHIKLWVPNRPPSVHLVLVRSSDQLVAERTGRDTEVRGRF